MIFLEMGDQLKTVQRVDVFSVIVEGLIQMRQVVEVIYYLFLPQQHHIFLFFFSRPTSRLVLVSTCFFILIAKQKMEVTQLFCVFFLMIARLHS